MQDQGSPGRAALWMVGAVASFTLMALAGREVSFALDTFEIMFYRSLVGVVLIVSITTMRRDWAGFHARKLGLHAVRNLAHFTGQNLWFFAIATIPLAQVVALEFTSPIWVVILAPLVLGERLTRVRVLAALIGFAGVLVVVRPEMSRIGPGELAAAACAVGFGLSALFTRKLRRTETTLSVLVWLTVMQAVFGLIAAGIDGDIAAPSLVTAPYLLVIGAAGLAAHLCLTTALGHASAAVVMPMDFARLPVLAVIGALVYLEPIDPWIIAGAGLIVLANWLNIRSETRSAAQKSHTAT
ncbi:multidrug DMT transporter permease [Roseovarius sp. 22II1-1F6A]|nr:multidrug DMT transporter permease [Roseovarius sp. 22II1-1F6A]